MSEIKIAVISALETERQCVLFHDSGIVAHLCGIGCRGCDGDALFSSLISQGVGGVISFGFAGGISPDISCGTVLIADGLIDRGGKISGIDLEWRTSLLRTLVADGHAFETPSSFEAPSPFAPPSSFALPSSCLLWSDGDIYQTVLEKRRLYEHSGAFGVDMESGILCRAAHSYGLPFLVIRVVSDIFSQDLPVSLAKSTTSKGDFSYFIVFRTQPFFSPGLARKLFDDALGI